MKQFACLLSGLALSAATLFASPAIASNLNVTGHVTGIFVSQPGNMAFRVGVDQALSNSCKAGFLYIDTNNSNYQTYVSSLLLAYSMGKSLNFAYSVDANGYCQIIEFGTA